MRVHYPEAAHFHIGYLKFLGSSALLERQVSPPYKSEALVMSSGIIQNFSLLTPSSMTLQNSFFFMFQFYLHFKTDFNLKITSPYIYFFFLLLLLISLKCQCMMCSTKTVNKYLPRSFHITHRKSFITEIYQPLPQTFLYCKNRYQNNLEYIIDITRSQHLHRFKNEHGL